MPEQERRRAPRVRIELRVRYRRDNGPVYYATLADISRSGLRLVGGEAMSTGSRLEISFDDPAGRRHEVVGDVVRSEPRGGFAVSMVEIDDMTLQFIEDALATTPS